MFDHMFDQQQHEYWEMTFSDDESGISDCSITGAAAGDMQTIREQHDDDVYA